MELTRKKKELEKQRKEEKEKLIKLQQKQINLYLIKNSQLSSDYST